MKIRIKLESSKYLHIYDLRGNYLFGLSLGNNKLKGKKFAILNFTPSFLCMSDNLNMCAVSKTCYAKCAEFIRQMVLRFRFGNYYFFQHYTEKEIMSAMVQVFRWLRDRGIKLLRLQESGDFISQWWLDLAYHIARAASRYDIKTFTYTARKDLKFLKSSILIIRGSGWDGPHGKTITLGKEDKLPDGFHECRKNCEKCGLCYNRKELNIAFRVHGTYREQPIRHDHWKAYHAAYALAA